MAKRIVENIKKPVYVDVISKTLSAILALSGIAAGFFAIYLFLNPGLIGAQQATLLVPDHIYYGIGMIAVGILLGLVGRGLWRYKNWARTILLTGLILFIIFYFKD